MDNGLELTVINVQRPLKVQGGVTLPADQQFILVTVQLRIQSHPVQQSLCRPPISKSKATVAWRTKRIPRP